MLARDDIYRFISAGLPVMLGFLLARTKTTIGLERPIEVFIYSFWPPAVVCHRGPPSTARAQVDHRTEIVAKLLNYAPAKPAHRDSAPIVSIEGFQGCGVAGSGRKSHLNVQQNAYLKGSITPEYSFSDFVFVLEYAQEILLYLPYCPCFPLRVPILMYLDFIAR